MLLHGSQTDPWGGNRTKSFRRSFFNQFSCIVSNRLAEAAELTRNAVDETRSDSLLPVLANREQAVEATVQDRFPDLRSMRTSVTNIAGVTAGQAAGHRADIGSSRLRGRQAALRS